MALLKQAWDDQKIIDLSEKLNRELPPTGGRIVVDDGPDETFVVGDRLGYLRLGAGLIQGATRSLGTNYGIENSLEIGANDLFNERPVVFQCVEDWVAYGSGEKLSPRVEAALKVTLGVVALGLLALLAIGGYTVFIWFSGGPPPN
jgi:hypothetical protein